MQRTLRAAAIAMVTTIISPGMSGGNPVQTKPAASAATEACSLLTKEAAAAALGEAVKGPERRSGMSAGDGTTASSCEYTGSGLHKVQLNLMQLTPATAAMYKMFCEKKGKEGLTQLGDTACWYNDKHEELQVLKGTTFFSIEFRGTGNPTEAIKGVAKSVYG